MRTFEDAKGNFLPPKWEAIKLIIDTVYAAQYGTKNLKKYSDPEGETSEEVMHSKSVRIEKIVEELFGEQEKTIDVVIYGNFDKNDYNLIRDIQKVSAKTVIIGENQGLSRALPHAEMLKTIASAKVLVTLTPGIFAPPRVLEASMYGAAVVSNMCEASIGVINDGIDGVLSKTPHEVPGIIRDLLGNQGLLASLTKNAKEKVKRENNTEQFLQKWSDVLYG
jgi:hypothetical protein